MERYLSYKDSGIEWIGQVPNDWKVNRLKTLCTFTYGESLAEEERIEGDIPVYGSNGIVGYHNKAITFKPCIIIGRKGSYGRVNFSEKECFPIDTTYFVDNRLAKCDLRWLSYVLPLLELDKFSKDTGVPGLNREDAHEKRVPVPEIKVQKILADYLDCKTQQIDVLIEKKERMIEFLKEERTAIINHAVTKGIDPKAEMKDSGIDWLGKVPKHWGIKKLKFIARLKSGDGIVADLIKEEGLYPVFGGNGLRGYTDTFTHEGSFILIGRQGALCGNVNYANGKFWASEHAVVVTLNKEHNVIWLGELLRAMNLNQYSQSAAQPGLAVDNIQDLSIPIPPNKEQEEIAVFLDKKNRQINIQVAQERRSIDLLKEYRTALISEVVTGKVDVRN